MLQITPEILPKKKSEQKCYAFFICLLNKVQLSPTHLIVCTNSLWLYHKNSTQMGLYNQRDEKCNE